jgi:ketosteroid isomerase-like protein
MAKKIAFGVVGLLVVLAAAVAQQKKAGGGDEAALKAIEEQWEAASLKADVATLGSLLAETFISISADGHMQTKAEMLAALKSGEVKFEKSDVDELKVQLYGNAAVMTGRWTGKVVEKGTPSESTERFTDTFIKQNGQWKCVASHSSPIH